MKREFGVKLKNVVRLLSGHLYPNSDVVLRELVQNAYDAIRRRYREKDGPGRVDITVDPSRRTLTVADNGTGMDEKELIDYLSTLGDGIKQLEKATANQPVQIGEYGIGFFSSFIIAEEIVVRTRSANDPRGCRWMSSGVDGYELAPDTEPLDEPGTRITLQLGLDSHKFSDPERVRALINRYCQFLDCPIHLNGSQEPINEMRFAWQYKKDADRATWVRTHMPAEVEFHKIGTGKAGNTSFEYVFGCGFHSPTERSWLYSKRMFVTQRLRFVPKHLEFMSVLVSCDGFRLDLARENVQQDATFGRVVERVEELLLDWLTELTRKHREEPQFRRMIRQHQGVFHELAARDPRTLDKIFPYLHFPVHGGDPIPVEEATQLPSAAPRSVLFTVPHPKGAAIPSDDSPFLLQLAKARNVPVFLPDDEDTVQLLRQVCTKYKVTLRRLTECPELRCAGGASVDPAIAQVRDHLAKSFLRSARVTSFPPPSLPLAVLGGTILLNADNPYLKELGQLKASINALRPIYTSLLGTFEALARTPPDAELGTVVHEAVETLRRWGEATAQAAEDQKRLLTLTDKWWLGPAGLAAVPVRDPFSVPGGKKRYTRRCMIVIPFSDTYRDVQNVVIATCAEFGIFAAAADQPENQDILQKVCRNIDGCDLVIADVSENNPNVLFELGIAMARRKPSIILSGIDRRDTRGLRTPTDIIGIERIEYTNATEDLKNQLRRILKQLGGGDAVQPDPGTE